MIKSWQTMQIQIQQIIKKMLEEIRKELNFTSLKFHRLDDLKASIGISPCKHLYLLLGWKRISNEQETEEEMQICR